MTKADLPAVSAMLGRAFEDDPITLHLYRGGTDLVPRVGRVMGILAASHLKDGRTWVTADCSAVGVWAPPEHWKTPPTLYLTHGLPMLRAIGFRNARHISTLAAIEKLHPTEPHHYLAILGADPSAQGKGYGSQLVRVVTDQADAELMPCYLESSKLANVPFYERHGFHVTREIRVAGNGPTVYAMWRDPRPPEA